MSVQSREMIQPCYVSAMERAINIKTNDDTETCYITGIAYMYSYRLFLVMSDNSNKKLKVLNLFTDKIVSQKSCESKPWGVCELTDRRFAVTFPYKREIHIHELTGGGKISESLITIPVPGQCMGITSETIIDTFGMCVHVHVVCRIPDIIVTVTIPPGKDLKEAHRTKKDQKINAENLHINPNCIAIDEESSELYIGAFANDQIVKLNKEGEISKSNTEIPGPWGLTTLFDGSLLVCCYNGSLYRVDENLEISELFMDGLQDPECMCMGLGFRSRQHMLYIGCRNNDKLKVLAI